MTRRPRRARYSLRWFRTYVDKRGKMKRMPLPDDMFTRRCWGRRSRLPHRRRPREDASMPPISVPHLFPQRAQAHSARRDASARLRHAGAIVMNAIGADDDAQPDAVTRAAYLRDTTCLILPRLCALTQKILLRFDAKISPRYCAPGRPASTLSA